MGDLEEIIYKVFQQKVLEGNISEEKLLELVPEIVNGSIPEFSKIIVKSYTSKKIKTEVDRIRKEHNRFNQRLQKRWGKPLELLEFFNNFSLEFGHEINSNLPDEYFNDVKFYVLVRLHARACQIASEILCLLKNGFSDGAMARWRSIYEIAVTMNFIHISEPILAERYKAYEAIESYYDMKVYKENADRMQFIDFTDDEALIMETEFNRLKDKYGKNFVNKYGWLDGFIGNKKPSFSAIESEARFSFLKPFYRLSNHSIHAGFHGSNSRIGLTEDSDILLAGPSDYGLTDPGQLTALSLLHCNSYLTGYFLSIDSVVQLFVLIEFQKKTQNAFAKSHEKMEKAIKKHKT